MDHSLTDEFAQAGAATRREHFDRMEALGVSRRTLWTGPAAFGFGMIEENGDLYQPRPDGFPAVIQPVAEIKSGLLTGIVDLIAWWTDNPAQWWTRRGIAPILGYESVERAAHYGEPLALHATPLDWLAANRQGTVILDWNAYLPFWLGGVCQIYTDPETAERLDSALHTARVFPEIFVKEEKHAA